MTRLGIVLVALLVATPVQAGWMDTLNDAWAATHRFLYPPKPIPPIPMPVPRPAIVPPPPAASPAPKIEAPPVAAPTPKKATPRKPAKKSKPKPKTKAKTASDEGGPDLPYPCWLVRSWSAGKSPAELERAGRDHGITPKQRRQAAACFR